MKIDKWTFRYLSYSTIFNKGRSPRCPGRGLGPPPGISAGAWSPGSEPSALEEWGGEMGRPKQCGQSRCTLSIHFAFEIQESFGLLPLHLTRLTTVRCIGNLSKCIVSVWASWFPLATVTAVGNALLWPNSQQTKAQKAKPMDLKARIINERDDFILVYKIVRRNVLKGLSMRRRSIRKQNNSSSSRL